MPPTARDRPGSACRQPSQRVFHICKHPLSGGSSPIWRLQWRPCGPTFRSERKHPTPGRPPTRQGTPCASTGRKGTGLLPSSQPARRTSKAAHSVRDATPVAATAPAHCRRPAVSLRASVRALCRLMVAATLAVTAGATAAAVAPSSAFASTYDFEAQFVAKMNAARQASGLAPYSVASDLTGVARNHSSQMASQQSLYHNPSLTTQVQNWQAVGENVGEGPTVSDIHTAFMNSPEHRANILDHDFTQVGVGVSVDRNGIIWVTEDFRKPMYSSSGNSASSGSSSASSSSPSHSGSTSHTTSAHSTPSYTVPSSHTSVAAPHPAPSPRAVLLHRLHELRHHSSDRHVSSDPVAQAFDYVNALAALTR